MAFRVPRCKRLTACSPAGLGIAAWASARRITRLRSGLLMLHSSCLHAETLPAGDQAFVRHGPNRHGLLHEAIEQLATVLGSASIEPERELVEVEVEMRGGDRALVGTQQPAF